MTTPRDVTLTSAQRALKLATQDAVAATEGQQFVARELGLAQSRISDYCSKHTADFIPIDKAMRLDTLAGAPHILRALCRAAGGEYCDAQRADDFPMSLSDHLPEIAGESGDLIRKLADQISHRKELTPTARDALIREVNQLANAAANLLDDLNHDRAPGPRLATDSS